jgi:hypothetical protein
VAAVARSLEAGGYNVSAGPDGVLAPDPWGTTVSIRRAR